MTKSPPLNNYREFSKFLKKEKIPKYMTWHGKYLPKEYPCLIVYNTQNREEDELEYIYLTDFKGDAAHA